MVLADATESSLDGRLVGLIVSGVFTTIFLVAFRRWFWRKNGEAYDVADRAWDSATKPEGIGDDSVRISMVVAPAPPLPETIERLRLLFGQVAPHPRITRYSRPTVMVSALGLAITEPKGGTLLEIPAENIISVRSEPALIHPKGVILARIFPSIHIGIRHGEAHDTLSVAPIHGIYEKLTPAEAAAIAGAFADLLGVDAR
jgi:hypothetical protein